MSSRGFARLFIGGIRLLSPENAPSGIFKSATEMPLWLGKEGLQGDVQADRRVHGGVEKALHQYPVAHYGRLAEAFPEARSLLSPGSIGENLSVPGWDESNVCIGDVFRLGEAVIQVSQPRSPCWKIDRRFGVSGMARFIENEGLTGWYFRVLEEGLVTPGCALVRIDRMSPLLRVDELLRIWRLPEPDPAVLQRLAATPGLAENWVRKLLERSRRGTSRQGGERA